MGSLDGKVIAAIGISLQQYLNDRKIEISSDLMAAITVVCLQNAVPQQGAVNETNQEHPDLVAAAAACFHNKHSGIEEKKDKTTWAAAIFQPLSRRLRRLWEAFTTKRRT